MEWIQTHIVEIFAIVGAVYTIARTIVALTPTPKDDIYLDKVGVLLKAIAKAAGLDLKQGVNTKEKP
jgi:hypothetical protein